MNFKSKKTWSALFLTLMLVVLAGCQSIEGLDLNKVLQNGASVKSVQGTQTMALEIISNPEVKPSPEEQRVLDLFGSVKIRMTEIKQQDPTHSSLKGVLEYKQGQIPFQVAISEQDFIFQIEGAQKPIVVRNSLAGSPTLRETISKEMQEQIKLLSKKASELTPSYVSYLAGLAPNPKTVSVFPDKYIMNAEQVKGQTVHIEIKGSELPELVKGFLTNLLADENGLKQLLGQLYELYVPIIQQGIKDGGDQSGPMNDAVAPYLSNKTLAVEFAFTFIKQQVRQFLDNYEQSIQQFMGSSQGEQAKQVLNDASYLKIDILVDHEMYPRKTDMELMLASPDKTSAVKAYKITSTSQLSNINKPVAADKIDTTAGAFELDSFGQPGKFLAALDPKSQLYQLLKNDLKITKKEIKMIVDDNSGNNQSTKPYNRNGVVMVPVRFVVEQLDADVDWEAATQRVTITDPVSGAVLKLNVGSKQATVNGMIKPLDAEAELTNGSTFVPVRFVAEGMGAKVGWDPSSQMVTISRD